MLKEYKRTEANVTEAITFDYLMEYGRNNGGNIVHGLPWSFNYKGRPVTHEHNKCYIIVTSTGTERFTPDDFLITLDNGEVYVCSIELFHKLFTVVK